MAKKLREILEKVKEPTGGLKKACWKGYTAVGMKMKNGRKVPNCVPVDENFGLPKPAAGDAADRQNAVDKAGTKLAGGQNKNKNSIDMDKAAEIGKEVLGYTPVGAAFSAKDAYDNIKKGEYGDAAIDAATGVAQVFGGPIVKGVGKVIRKIGPTRGAAAGLAAGTTSAGDVKEEIEEARKGYAKGYKSPWDKIEKAKPGIGARIDAHAKELNDLDKKYKKIVDKEEVKECNGNLSCGCDEVDEDAKGHKSPSGGLTQKGRDYYNRKTGGNLKAPVTTPPSKLKKGSKAANRRKSFCARMGGMKKRLTSAKTANDPDSRINKALRKWNC